MRVLYQFPLSHYCEKARWLLDHKELDYVAKNLLPGFHRTFTYLKSGQYLLPMLNDDKNWVADSRQIALYLDDMYPEQALLRRDETLRQDALAIDDLAGELGFHVRRWTLALMLQKNDRPLDIMLGEQGYLRLFSVFSKPIVRKMVVFNYQLHPAKVAQSKVCMDVLIAQLNRRLIEQQGNYLVGDRLGLADIAVCSMLAPILMIKGTPWELEHEEFEQLTDELKDYYYALLDLPLGQYVRRIYHHERHARVDWRGV
ncbi:MAG: glutathione S-transferase family protein [Acinetobacter sp.]|nr:MAG: glutathione S-transferase family protein [Acinetobacter sp.]